MKKANFYKLSTRVSLLMFGCLNFYSVTTLALNDRLTVRGLVGSESYADVDGLMPIYVRGNSLVYLDGQAKYAEDNDWYAGLGTGYRGIYGCTIYGGNLFIDRAESINHHDYWILSPGLETMTACWDLRINGYIPFNHRHNEDHFFPSGPNECGINGDCSFVEFHGHQQFEHRFVRFEEVGPGVDAATGVYFPRLNCAKLTGGLYYYHMQDATDVMGVAARFDIPINSNWAITSEASYDNQQRSALALGLRFQLGHTPKSGCCPTLCDRLYDPIYRYVGSTKRGSGIPIERSKRDEGLFLRRDNIYFFSQTGTAIISESNAGTFENPLAATTFTDATLAAISTTTPNANLYFNSGNYLVDPGGNSLITLLAGQSMFGRTTDFKCSAVGAERPLFVDGEIEITSSNHVLDSIALRNVGSATTVIGLDILNANNVHICNSDIEADATVGAGFPGTNIAIGIRINNSDVTIDSSDITAFASSGTLVGGENVAIGISANNSIVEIDPSSILALALVSGNVDAGGTNAAIGIGNFNTSTSNNIFLIEDSRVSASAIVEGLVVDVVDLNSATGIGNIASNSAGLLAIFAGNQFTIVNSQIASNATVGGLSSNNTSAVGIGNTALNISAGSSINFTNNVFNLDGSSVTATTNIANNNTNFLVTAGIGNYLSISSNSTALFSDNVFKLCDAAVVSSAFVGGASNFNLETGIGNNGIVLNPNSSINFERNNFTINHSTIESFAALKTTNTSASQVAGIGNNAFAFGSSTADFANNNFNILNNSEIIASSAVTADSLFNLTTGIGINALNIAAGSSVAFRNNQFTIFDSNVSATALQGSINSVTLVSGIGNNSLAAAVFDNNNFQIHCANVSAETIVSGDLNGTNQAIGVNGSGILNTIDIFDSTINVLASVRGANNGTNRAVGLSALGSSTIRIFDSIVNVRATALSEPNDAIGSEGNVIAENTIFNVVAIP